MGAEPKKDTATAVGHSRKAKWNSLAFPFLMHFNVPPKLSIGSASLAPSPRGISMALCPLYGREELTVGNGPEDKPA